MNNAETKVLKVQNTLLKIIEVLYVLSLLGVVFVALRTYMPYKLFMNYSTDDYDSLLWTIIVVPTFVSTMSLWVVNMLCDKYSSWFIILTFVTGGAICSVPFLFRTLSGTPSYLITPMAVFLVTVTLIALIVDGFKAFKPKNILTGKVIFAFTVICEIVATYFAIRFIYTFPFPFYRLLFCCVVPVLFGAMLIICLAGVPYSIVPKDTVILMVVWGALGTVLCITTYSSAEFETNWMVLTILVLFGLMCCLHIFNYIRYLMREDKR